MSHSALIVIDLQNDYFPAGAYPQYQAEQVLAHTLSAIDIAQQRGWPVVLVQHVGGAEAPFFKTGSDGVKLHSALLAQASASVVVEKQHADSFLNTTLSDVLRAQNIRELVVCGMMTQNCVTHTALSPAASDYSVRVLSDACSAPDAMVHGIALRALSDRVPLITLDEL
ncbi:cysteine hydrolase family protein [Vibrio furnissii]|uniref:cysteine hydrolase family protein n=1 Tax=Vibrio furnissii TaxID=29494 RepID=UPI000200D80A|nr:cysteine hydrolase family protein [Vibrio furnissii]ADT89138.1 isochorismatase family protein [Vibrio furnissii NCTC 11218]